MHLSAKAIFLLIAVLTPGGSSLTAQGILDIPVESVTSSRTSLRSLADTNLVYVMFWATWCQPCQTEMRVLSKSYPTLREKGIRIIAVSVDDVRSTAKAKTFIRTQRYTFPSLFDPGSKLFQALNGQSVPYGVWINRSGSVLIAKSGYMEGEEDELERDYIRLTSGNK